MLSAVLYIQGGEAEAAPPEGINEKSNLFTGSDYEQLASRNLLFTR